MITIHPHLLGSNFADKTQIKGENKAQPQEHTISREIKRETLMNLSVFTTSNIYAKFQTQHLKPSQ